MSSDKPKTVKPKVMKEKKTSVEVPKSDPIDIPKPEPKQRASRAKKVATKEETMKALLDASNELKQIVVDIKEDTVWYDTETTTSTIKRNIAKFR